MAIGNIVVLRPLSGLEVKWSSVLPKEALTFGQGDLEIKLGTLRTAGKPLPCHSEMNGPHWYQNAKCISIFNQYFFACTQH